MEDLIYRGITKRLEKDQNPKKGSKRGKKVQYHTKKGFRSAKSHTKSTTF
jgi:hypothetical protein